MAIRVAGQDIDDLPAQQVLRIDGGIRRGILQQLVAVGKGRAAVFLVFFLKPVSQRLAEVFLVQTLHFSAFLRVGIPYAIISVGYRVNSSKAARCGRVIRDFRMVHPHLLKNMHHNKHHLMCYNDACYDKMRC